MPQPNGSSTLAPGVRYRIIESEIGPLISESRCTVFDVMELHDAGELVHEISAILNLTPLQVETALSYIALRREALVPQLAEILAKRAERERRYRVLADEIQRQIAATSMRRRHAEIPMPPRGITPAMTADMSWGVW